MTVKELIDKLRACDPDAKVVYPEYEGVSYQNDGATANEVKRVTSLDHECRGPHVVLHDASSRFTKYGWVLK